MQEKDSIVSQQKLFRKISVASFVDFSKEIDSTEDRLFGPLCILEYDSS